MKKTYQKPAMQVLLLQQRQMLCGSGGQEGSGSKNVQSLENNEGIYWNSDGIEVEDDDY